MFLSSSGSPSRRLRLRRPGPVRRPRLRPVLLASAAAADRTHPGAQLEGAGEHQPDRERNLRGDQDPQIQRRIRQSRRGPPALVSFSHGFNIFVRLLLSPALKEFT